MTTGFFTGAERIELPLRVLETPVIPFDQAPICICCQYADVTMPLLFRQLYKHTTASEDCQT